MYIHERKDWPKFTWDRDKIAKHLAEMFKPKKKI